MGINIFKKRSKPKESLDIHKKWGEVLSEFEKIVENTSETDRLKLYKKIIHYIPVTKETDRDKLYNIRRELSSLFNEIDRKLYVPQNIDEEIRNKLIHHEEKYSEKSVRDVVYSNGFYLDYVGEKASKILQEHWDEVDVLFGIPVGGIPFLISTFFHTNLPYGIVYYDRNKPEIYGKDLSGNKAVVLDDFTISGKEILNAKNILRSYDYEINKAFVILEVKNEGRKNLKNEGVDLYSLFKLEGEK